MARLRPRSPASRLFTHPFVQAQIKENIKAPRHWPSWGNSPVTSEFPAKGTVTRKMFPFDDAIMKTFSIIYICSQINTLLSIVLSNWQGLTWYPGMKSNYTHYKVWDEINYQSSNFNGATVEVWEWISNFISQFTKRMITYACWDESLSTSVKGFPVVCYGFIHINKP